jgi:26S proteasome regulatory subunit T5
LRFTRYILVVVRFHAFQPSTRLTDVLAFSRKMNVDPGVDFDELARSSPDFNGAQLMAVCVEAGMIALRRKGRSVLHEDFVEGIAQVISKKKLQLRYYV